MERNLDYLGFAPRSYLVNNERVFFSAAVTKFSDANWRYDTQLVLTDQALYNYYRNAVKRRAALTQVEAVTISIKSSEFVVHVAGEADLRLHLPDLRNDFMEALLFVLCDVRRQCPDFKVYEVDLLNLDGVTTNRARAAQGVKIRPREDVAHFWNSTTWKQRERESLDRRLQKRRNTRTLYVNPASFQKNDVCLDDFEILKVLGKGAFGKVVLAQKKDSGKYYAIKILKKAHLIDSNMIQKTLAEKTILQKASHPFLVGLHYAFQTETKLYFVLEFMVGGELFNHIRREARFTEQRAKFYAVCIALGIGFLHDSGFIYRDLKLENVLLDDRGYAVLTDFGFAKYLGDSKKTWTFCGTPDYVAPEILEEKGHDRMVDWWSFGVLLYEMIHGNTPFFSDNRNLMYQNIKTREPTFPGNIPLSDAARDLILRLLQKNPLQRIGQLGDAREILAHPFFADIDVDAVLQRRLPAPFQPDTRNLENNFEREFLNENVRPSVDGASRQEVYRIRSYEKDFEQMNFNKDSVNKRPGG